MPRQIAGLLLLLFLIHDLHAQEAYFDRSWKIVDSLYSKEGLTRDAVAWVDRIYTKAKSIQNTPQRVKALMYKIYLEDQYEEGALQNGIDWIEKEWRTAPPVLAALLKSYQAQVYYGYSLRRPFNPPGPATKTAGITGWSREQFQKKVLSCYVQSLREERILQQTSLAPLNAILEKGNVRHLRPTLFDLLAHRALEFLQSGLFTAPEPIHPFEVDQESFFAPLQSFITTPIPTTDSSSPEWNSLRLYQRLLAFHLTDKSPEARLDADLLRLRYVHAQSTLPLKDSLYLRSLKNLISSFKSLSATDQAKYLEAEWYRNRFTESPDTHADYLLMARSICEEVLQRKDSSEGRENCRRLLEELLEQKLTLTAEKVNLPRQPFRILAAYKNITATYIRIIPVNEQMRASYFQGEDSPDALRREMASTPPLRSYRQPLPDAADLKEHRVELGIEGLAPGLYVILASLRPDFADSANILCLLPVHISSLSWINVNEHYYALHRETGKPLPGAEAEVWYQPAVNPGETPVYKKGPRFIADSLGHFTISLPEQEPYLPIKIDLRWQGDRLFTDEAFHTAPLFYNTLSALVSYRSFLFTDRSIYRPGQMVFFKGLVVRSLGDDRHEIASAFPGKMFLLNANGQKIDSLTYHTSAFGSYKGSFRLPLQMPNGFFSLQDANGNGYLQFLVEEYKRPRFQVGLNDPRGTPTLNDTVTVKGEALAFGGFGIGNARVAYRVVRRTYFPIWHDALAYFPRRPQPLAASREIINGVTTTNEQGSFEIAFRAIPDGSVKKADEPVFYFEVEASVTDLNGETQTTERTIPLSYQRFFLTIDLPASLPADSLRNIRIRTENLYGDAVSQQVSFKVTPLQKPSRPFRERFWPAPDRFLYDEQSYHRQFPLDLYDKEDNPYSWERDSLLLVRQGSTKADGYWEPAITLKKGWYLIAAEASGNNGEKIRTEKVIELTETEASARNGFYLTMEAGAASFQVNEEAPYFIRSNHDSLWLIRLECRIKEPVQVLPTRLGQHAATYKINIRDKDHGGVITAAASVRHNRFYFTSTLLPVPFTHKQLQIHYSSFRDKTSPGSTEQWSLKVSGIKNDTVTAEVLSSLYDASLDKIRAQSWMVPDLWTNRPLMPYVSSDRSFSSRYAADHRGIVTQYEGAVKNYERLKDFLQQQPSENYYIRTLTAAPVSSISKSEKQLTKNNTNDQGIEAPAEVKPPAVKAPETLPVAKVRENFEETAFFLPDMRTDSSGEVTFLFTLPQSITRWKWMTLAHTRDLALGYVEKQIISQKTLMLSANPPRYFREGDRMDYPVKITNISDEEITGQIQLQLIDPETQEPVDGWFRNFFPNQYFTVPARGNVSASFSIEVPYQFHRPVIARAIARTSMYSDGEAYTIPVLTNRILITESLPLQSREKGTKEYSFDKLRNSGTSENMENHALTIEYTPDPAWVVIEALPYLMEKKRENSEQLMQRYYANTIAGWLAHSFPAIGGIIKKWPLQPESAYQSTLEKDQELKSVLLRETPWVVDAADEVTLRKRAVQALDPDRIQEEQGKIVQQLYSFQTQRGGFPWFKGGPEDRFITQNILIGIGRLAMMGINDPYGEKLKTLVSKALRYLDEEASKDHAALLKISKDTAHAVPSPLQVQYLYLRSFFPDRSCDTPFKKSYEFYYRVSSRSWLRLNKPLQAMVALTAYRRGNKELALRIMRSLEQQALVTEKYGTYWKDFLQSGFYWYAVPIASHVLLTEAFAEIRKDSLFINGLKTWLLLQKQTQHWRDEASTADACYILLKGLEATGKHHTLVDIRLGDKITLSNRMDSTNAPIKMAIEGRKVKPELGNISVTVKTDRSSLTDLSWGAVYWQYFDDLPAVTKSEGPLKVTRDLYRKESGAQGTQWVPLTEGTVLQVGDPVKIRLTIQADRFLEYVHLKDLRASCFEPAEQSSGYQWQGGLGFYKNSKDASADFYIPALPKGYFTLEYPVWVTHTGTFTGGMASIQCLYAPAFTSHTEGTKVIVE